MITNCFKIIFIAAVFSISATAQISTSPNRLDDAGQRDGQWTIPFDRTWIPTNDTSNAAYFRIVTYQHGHLVGPAADFYISGNKQWVGQLLSEHPDLLAGRCLFYYPNGHLRAEGEYVKGMREGRWVEYYANGHRRSEGEYERGRQTDQWQYWTENGSADTVTPWENDIWTKTLGEWAAGNTENASMLLASIGPIREQKPEEKFSTLFLEASISKKRGDVKLADSLLSCIIRLIRSGDDLDIQTYLLSLESLGEIKLELQSWSEAEPYLREAARVARYHLGESHPNHIACLYDLLNATIAIGDSSGAEALCFDALAIFRRHNIDPDVRFLGTLADIQKSRGRLAEAESLYTQVVEVAKKLTGEGSIYTGVALYQLGSFYQQTRQLLKAREALSSGAKIVEGKLGSSDSISLPYKLSLANLNLELRDFTEASRIYGEIKQECKVTFGPNSVGYFELVRNSALAGKGAGNYQAADSCFREVAELNGSQFGYQSNEYLRALGDIAEYLLEIKWYAQAESTITRTLQIEQNLTPSADTLLADTMTRLGLVCENTNRMEKAATTYLQAIALLEQAHATKTFRCSLIWSGLGRSYAALGLTEEAIRACIEAKVILDEIADAPTDNRDGASIALGDALTRGNRLVAADSVLSSCLSVDSNTSARKEASASRVLLELAIVRQTRRMYQSADSLVRLYISTLPADSSQGTYANALELRGRILNDWERYEEADSILFDAGQIFLELDRCGAGSAQTAIDRYLVCKKLGRKEAARSILEVSKNNLEGCGKTDQMIYVQTLGFLAAQHLEDDNPKATREILETVRGILRPSRSPTDTVLLPLRNTLADAYIRLGMYDAADSLLTRMITHSDCASEYHYNSYLWNVINLAKVRSRTGLTSAIDSLILSASSPPVLPSPSRRVLQALFLELAGLFYSDHDRYRLAVPFFRAAATIRLDSGPVDSTCANTLWGLVIAETKCSECRGADSVLQVLIQHSDVQSERSRAFLQTARRSVIDCYLNLRLFARAFAIIDSSSLEMRRSGIQDQLSTASLLNLKAETEMGLCDFRVADSILDFTRRTLAPDSPKTLRSLARTLRLIADCAYSGGDYPKAERYTRERLTLLGRRMGEDSFAYAEAKADLGALLANLGRIEDAEPLLSEAVKVIAQFPDSSYAGSGYITVLNYYGMLLFRMGRYAEADSFFRDVLARVKTAGWRSTILNNLGELNLSTGRYVEAESQLLEATDLARINVGTSNPSYGMNLASLGKCYVMMNRSYDAIEKFKEARDVFLATLGESYPYALALGDLGWVEAAIGQFESAERDLFASNRIIGETLGKAHPEFLKSSTLLAGLAAVRGDFARAESLYSNALSIQEATNDPEYAATLAGLAGLRIRQDNWSDAISLLIRAKDRAETVYGKLNPTYLNILAPMALCYAKTGDEGHSFDLTEEMLEGNLKLTIGILPSLGERERDSLIQPLASQIQAFMCLARRLLPIKPDISSSTFNLAASAKGLLLNSYLIAKSRILESKDSSVVLLFKKWMSMHAALARIYSQTKEQAAKEGVDVDSLIRATDDIENRLTHKSRAFASRITLDLVNWKTLAGVLKPNEAAVEIVRFESPGEALHDTVQYAAMIVRGQDYNPPKVVFLNDGRSLESADLQEYSQIMKDQQHGLLTAEQAESALQLLYEKYWSPIQAALGGVSGVYLCPDGVYHKINIQTLVSPETHRFLLEDMQIHLVTTLHDLLTPREQEDPVQENPSELFGYPDYYLSAERREVVAGKYERGLGLSESVGLGDSLDRHSLAPLPGSRMEAEGIQHILIEHHLKANLHLGDQAVEEAVKAVRSPRVLLLATHGYFLSDLTHIATDELVFGIQKERLVQNPLLRSGLLFAGAGAAMRIDRALMKSDDGILTAYEAMNLDLENTDLVVLSACETGLGEVRNGEGVYGLQRAFRVAGAKAIIMSLWRVNDEATLELTSTFFKYWLSGMSKSDALRKAQMDLRRRFPQPYYWGPFVMVGD